MSADNPQGYEVGYGRPPKTTQFKKGESGNPKGRPKIRRDIVSTLERTLAEPVTLRDGNTTGQMSAEEAVIHAQVLKAMQGDQTAFNSIMKQAKRCGLILPRRQHAESSRVGILLVPDPMTREEWENAANEVDGD